VYSTSLYALGLVARHRWGSFEVGGLTLTQSFAKVRVGALEAANGSLVAGDRWPEKGLKKSTGVKLRHTKTISMIHYRHKEKQEISVFP
jgi:hypothetical protein